MATYVMSDLHGDYRAMKSVLNKANFNENDVLYILGDIADRGEDFYKIFSFVKSSKNVIMLSGNHEENLIKFIRKFRDIPIRSYDFCLSCAKLDDIKNFYMLQYSIESVARECGEERTYDVLRNEILPFLLKLPAYKTVEVNGRKFFLCHAGVDYSLPIEKQTREILTRIRQPFNSQDKDFYGYTVIHGHTTVQNLTKDKVAGDVLFGKHKISIDGGASAKVNGRLNLLRLDDMQVFYSPAPKTFVIENYAEMKI